VDDDLGPVALDQAQDGGLGHAVEVEFRAAPFDRAERSERGILERRDERSPEPTAGTG